MFTTPTNSSLSIRNRIARNEIEFVNPRDELPTVSGTAAETTANKSEQFLRQKFHLGPGSLSLLNA